MATLSSRLVLGLLEVPVRLRADRAGLVPPPRALRLTAVWPAERLPAADPPGRFVVGPATGAERALRLLARVLGDLGAAAWAEGEEAGVRWEGLIVPAAGGLVLAPGPAGALPADGEPSDEEIALAMRLVSTLPVRLAATAGPGGGPGADAGGGGVLLDLAAARAARAARPGGRRGRDGRAARGRS